MAMRVLQRCFRALVLVRRFSVVSDDSLPLFHDRVEHISSHQHTHEPGFVLAVYPLGCYRSQVEWVSVNWEVFRHFVCICFVIYIRSCFSHTLIIFQVLELEIESRRRRTSPLQICLCFVPQPFMPNRRVLLSQSIFRREPGSRSPNCPLFHR